MRTCPTCGPLHDLDAVTCTRCGHTEALPAHSPAVQAAMDDLQAVLDEPITTNIRRTRLRVRARALLAALEEA